ncbi:unnamed protein product [Caenorhabditis sp. 36 PRJEB53466]|nr:unnamed protein product [Caenorhabditis sp. 36 PRJEB53466]
MVFFSGLTKYQQCALIISLFFFLNVYLLYNTAQHTQLRENTKHEVLTSDKVVKEEEQEGKTIQMCEIDDELAKSAISRAVTPSCKRKLETEACQLKNGTFTDRFPTSQCPNHEESIIDSRIGCYSDRKEARVLKEFEYKFPKSNSKSMCRKNCYKAGFLFYGLEFGQECFCGNALTNGTKVEDKECQTYKCPDSDDFCGGFNAVEIFRTGLRKQVVPRKPKYLPPSSEEEPQNPAKILFLLQLNGRNERQVKRFLKSIYLPHHYYYIHVDKRQNYMYSEMQKVAEKVDNIHITGNRFSSIWGGASLLQVFQQVIRDSLNIEKFRDWEYIFNFSESDFPILPIQDFERQITANKGMSFLASHGYNTGKFIQKQGFEFVFSECDQRMFRIGKRDFPENLRIDGGSDWVGIHRNLAEFSISDEELPQKLRKLFESILLPLESFYHTLSFNSKFCDDIIMSNLRLTNWYRKQGCRCASLKAIVDWCGCSPLVFREETKKKFELQKAIAKPSYFARKFDSMVDVESIEAAEKQALPAEKIREDHPAYHFAFANIFKNGIDEARTHFQSLANFALKTVESDVVLTKVVRIDALRAHHDAQIEIVMKVETSSGDHHFLLHRLSHVEFSHPKPEVDGYILKDLTYGTKFEWKEEICREYMGFVTDTDTFHVRLQWEASERVKKNGEKTSPDVELKYRNGTEAFEHSKVKPYDSVFGGQFDSLKVDKKLANLTTCDPLAVDVISPSASPNSPPLATLLFPVYTPQNEHCHEHLLSKFFHIADFCSSEEACSEKVWSTSFPDPKSDILFGYDTDTRTLQWKADAEFSFTRPSSSRKRPSLRSVPREHRDSACDDRLVRPSVLRKFTARRKQFIPGRLSRAVRSVLDTTIKPSSGIYYADVYQDEYCHINAFGLTKVGSRIPLHDHPSQHAVMKIFRGSVKIRSFTVIPDEEKDSDDSDASSTKGHLNARYEGETVVSSDSEPHWAVLEPTKGNIHEVICLEQHTYFCDFFVPNTPVCYYYRVVDNEKPPVSGQVMEKLRKEGWSINETQAAEFFPDNVLPKTYEEIRQTLLDEDLRQFGEPSIVNKLVKDANVFEGPCVLQLLRYRNVSVPRIREEMNQPDPANSLIRLFFTDGHISISAVILTPIPGINSDTPPGTKILITRKVNVEGTFLILTAKDIEILGGRVPDMIEKWHIEKNSVRAEGFNVRNLGKKATGAPKWVSFGKKGKIGELEKGFKANSVMPKNQNQNEDEEDEFAKNREQMIKEMDIEKPTFARSNLAPPPPKEQVPRVPKEPKEPKPRKEFKRRGRKNSEDGPDVDLGEYADHKPSGGVTLFDFLGEGEKAAATSSARDVSRLTEQTSRMSMGGAEIGGAKPQQKSFGRGGHSGGPRGAPFEPRNDHGKGRGGHFGGHSGGRGEVPRGAPFEPRNDHAKGRGGHFGGHSGGRGEVPRGAPFEPRNDHGIERGGHFGGHSGGRGEAPRGAPFEPRNDHAKGRGGHFGGHSGGRGEALRGAPFEPRNDHGIERGGHFGGHSGGRGEAPRGAPFEPRNDHAKGRGGHFGGHSGGRGEAPRGAPFEPRNDHGIGRGGPSNPRRNDERQQNSGPVGRGKQAQRPASNFNERKEPPKHDAPRNFQNQQHQRPTRNDQRHTSNSNDRKGENHGPTRHDNPSNFQNQNQQGRPNTVPPQRQQPTFKPNNREAQNPNPPHHGGNTRSQKYEIPRGNPPQNNFQRGPPRGSPGFSADQFPPPTSSAGSGPQWRVGSQCVAPWTDGGSYPATITEMLPDRHCTVRYNEYGNTHTLPIDFLVFL